MYTTEDLVEFGKGIGDTKPELPYCISTINEALSTGIIKYVAGLIKNSSLARHHAQETAEKLINFWPLLRKDGFASLAKYPELRKEVDKAFANHEDELIETSQALNTRLNQDKQTTQALDTMFGGQHDDIFPPKSDDDASSEYIFLYDDLSHPIKGEHTTVNDIEFSQQLAKVGLTNKAVVDGFLSLAKNVLQKDSKYRHYDMETEAFREAFPNAAKLGD